MALALGLLYTLTLPAQQPPPYKIIAYYTGSSEPLKQYPLNKITHVIYSFLALHHDTLGFRNQQQETYLENIVALKQQYPHLKIMVSIGGWGGCAPCSGLFSSEHSRKTFAQTTVALFRKYGIDGLDLDWEYPAIEGYPGHAYKPDDKQNFTALVQELRKEMGNRYLLSFAAGGFEQFLEASIEWEKVMPLLDFVNLMTYDLVGGYSTVTGHHTPQNHYREKQQSVSRCVRWLLNKKVEPEKLIVGAAFYARVWEQVPDTLNGLYQSGKFKQGVAFKDFSTYFSDSSGFRYYWDKKAKAPFQYNKQKKLFATFDNERSVREKARFIKRKKLGGIMFWELIQDKPKNGLVDELHRALNSKE
ncbi:MAG: glycoside hydrolase family 18 protein [Dinghuibacter sp.]|nr:glycoside hydrolase family 18 protein [Dinghuibacter sp.]